MEVNIWRSYHSYSFVQASTYLSTVITRLYQPINPSSDRFRKTIIYTTFQGGCVSGRGGQFGGYGHVRGYVDRVRHGRGGHSSQVGHIGWNGTKKNGINISDVTRYFDDEEWYKLSHEMRGGIIEDPVHTKFIANTKWCIKNSVNTEKDN